MVCFFENYKPFFKFKYLNLKSTNPTKMLLGPAMTSPGYRQDPIETLSRPDIDLPRPHWDPAWPPLGINQDLAEKSRDDAQTQPRLVGIWLGLSQDLTRIFPRPRQDPTKTQPDHRSYFIRTQSGLPGHHPYFARIWPSHRQDLVKTLL